MNRWRVPVTWAGAVAVLLAVGPTTGDLPATDVGTWVMEQPDAALGVATGAAAWLILVWLALGYLVVLGSRSLGRTGRWSRRAARVLLPGVVRRALESAIGVSVLLATATPALAASTSIAGTGAAPAATAISATAVSANASATSGLTAGGPLPSLDRPATTTTELAPLPAVPAPVLAPLPAVPAPSPDPVLRGQLPRRTDAIVVRRGDCLWSVVARALGPGASDADVARAWPRWYAANRTVIGPDPDLLLPGQRISPPGPPATTSG